MIEKVKGILSNIKADKRLLLIVFLGVMGIVLLVFSEILPDGEVKDDLAQTNVTDSISEYEENLENRLSQLLSKINGAGDVKVMITVACSDENVYATEQKQSEKSSERKYVIVDNSREETGLLLKVAEPEIRGVGIVCSGSDSTQVRQEIINTVSAVLNISSNRISIAKMKNSNGG